MILQREGKRWVKERWNNVRQLCDPVIDLSKSKAALDQHLARLDEVRTDIEHPFGMLDAEVVLPTFGGVAGCEQAVLRRVDRGPLASKVSGRAQGRRPSALRLTIERDAHQKGRKRTRVMAVLSSGLLSR